MYSSLGFNMFTMSAIITTLFPSPQKEAPYLLAATPSCPLLPSLATTNLLLSMVYLIWTFHINGHI